MERSFAFLAALAIGLVPPVLAKESPPNVIFFAVDDLCDWVGAMGYDQAKTPNMDALAQGDVSFNNAHWPALESFRVHERIEIVFSARQSSFSHNQDRIDPAAMTQINLVSLHRL